SHSVLSHRVLNRCWHQPSQPHVGYLANEVPVKQNVSRFEITVHNWLGFGLMEEQQAATDLSHNLPSFHLTYTRILNTRILDTLQEAEPYEDAECNTTLRPLAETAIDLELHRQPVCGLNDTCRPARNLLLRSYEWPRSIPLLLRSRQSCTFYIGKKTLNLRCSPMILAAHFSQQQLFSGIQVPQFFERLQPPPLPSLFLLFLSQQILQLHVKEASWDTFCFAVRASLHAELYISMVFVSSSFSLLISASTSS
ncbi:hypothetical protein Ccrd_002340, partial [Cynara cardunculus var. scolymus]